MKNDVEEFRGITDWKARAAEREGWKARCMMGYDPIGRLTHTHTQKRTRFANGTVQLRKCKKGIKDFLSTLTRILRMYYVKVKKKKTKSHGGV